MTDSGSREIIVTESEHDCEALRDKVLCCGHSMVGPDGIDRINVIWKRARPGPITTFEWQTKYALANTFTESRPGVIVSIVSDWQECRLGESYQINGDGQWERAPAGSDMANCLTIAGNAYKDIHPVVGICAGSSQHYIPAYVEPYILYVGSKADYQPGPYSRVWYASDHHKMSQFIQCGDSEPDAATIDTLVPNPRTHQFVWELTFDPESGKWTNGP
ncbi:putative carbamoyl-phosphate synthase [Pseudozyma hubeiensis SY62]|uniref:Putative carbamoyl-phosphate synthase n=1 Tax=Pseudozyma hubeiensis (strain SY62) TaxID=1305764 RepID=R9NY72_PSEHS|nr:putative carbamoyl-phosphate synthase [Pseudozyma hubeiensis SY62]GAC93596.1 putative carbamoyl-phosphate synthase [Pseudozyma hubeiensis SY62]